MNVITFWLKLMREMHYINLRTTHNPPLWCHMPTSDFKSSNQQSKAEQSTSTHLDSGSQNLHKQQGDIGGHKERTFSFDILEPYLTNFTPPSQPSHIQFSFVDHVDDIGSLQYQYTHAHVPLHLLFTILKLTRAKNIASKHGILAGSRCTMADLQAHVTGHTCLACNTHNSIFLVEHNKAYASMKRSKSHREKKPRTTSEPQEVSNKQGDLLEKVKVAFPPTPVDSELGHKIIASACKKMSRPYIEEAGCAVCGELKPVNEMSRLKSVKNLLHILVSPGVTRKERKDTASPIQEFSGPVLDYKCNKICDQCCKAI